MSNNEKGTGLSALQKARRQESADFAISSSALEGVIATEETRGLLKRWIDGEISTKEMLAISKKI